MTYTTIVSVEDAARHLDDPNWAFVDSRFVLGQPDRGREAYEASHIPGAVYADLDRDLSGEVIPGHTGRHPLPSQQAFDAVITRLGIGADTQVVAYDQSTGAMAASRLWWLLRWAGHDAVAALDGGFDSWQEAGLPTASGREERVPTRFEGSYRPEMTVGADEILAELGSGRRLLVDSRAADRYRGENETVDPVAGHIPGAASLPYAGNLDPSGHFSDAVQLRQRFEGLGRPADSTVFYCGSGVTAAHNVLAYAHAGLGMPRLYPGSWSEWITDLSRPVETGESGQHGLE